MNYIMIAKIVLPVILAALIIGKRKFFRERHSKDVNKNCNASCCVSIEVELIEILKTI